MQCESCSQGINSGRREEDVHVRGAGHALQPEPGFVWGFPRPEQRPEQAQPGSSSWQEKLPGAGKILLIHSHIEEGPGRPDLLPWLLEMDPLQRLASVHTGCQNFRCLCLACAGGTWAKQCMLAGNLL